MNRGVSDPSPESSTRATSARDPAGDHRGAQPRPPGTFRIGTIAGSDVLVSSSWFLVAALIAFVMAPDVEDAQPGLGAWKYLAACAVRGAALPARCCCTRRRTPSWPSGYGFPVSSITLHFLGGVTAIEGEARKPREEFMIAVVGPAHLAGGRWRGGGPDPRRARRAAAAGGRWASPAPTCWSACLNLVPGLPLDGGRVLKAGVWGVTGGPHQATLVAGWGGRVTAVAVLRWPLLISRVHRRRAEHHRLRAGVRDRAVPLDGRDATPSASARLRSAASRARGARPGAPHPRRARRPPAGRGHPPGAGGRGRRHRDRHQPPAAPVGVVNEAAVLATPEDRRPWVAVSTVARTLDEGLRLPVAIAGEELLLAISRTPAQRVPPGRDDGSIYGVLATADVDEAFREQPRALTVRRACPRVAAHARRRHPRGLVRRPSRTAARRGVGAADRRQGTPPQHLPRARQAVLLQPRPLRPRRADRPRRGRSR